jgi:tetratricopeptide (TPR) repeat protein
MIKGSIFVLITLLIARLSLAKPGQESEAISKALAEARSLIDTGKPKEAIEKLKALTGPGDPRIAQMLGVAFYHANEPVRAIEQLGSVVEKLPEGSAERQESIQVLGLSHYLAGRLAESIPYLEQTRAWVPNNLELAYALGMAYIQTRQPDKARASVARMFGVAEDSPAGHLLTAQMMVRVEFEELAEAELKRALEMDPKLPHAHFLLGQIAIFRNRLEEGIDHLKRELELNPGNSMALYRLGDAYGRQLKWAEAIAALQRSLWINPYYSGPYILLGKAYMKKNQPSTAEEMLRRAIQSDPNNKSAHYMLGQALQQLGRLEEAKREFEIAGRLRGETR